MPLQIAVLVKQIPAAEELRLDPDGRLVRDGTALEMSAYCRRAVSKGVELAAADRGSVVTVFTLGPPPAADVLREAVAWGLDRGVDIRGVLVSDPALAGSDTIATAGALAAALRLAGPFDLILTGRNSLDADTGQVPPQLAELLDLPFATGVKTLALDDGVLSLGCELDDTWVDAEVRLPAVLSCAERLCEPAKVPPDGRTAVPGRLIRTIDAAALGPGPWGGDASLTTVGETRVISTPRARRRTPGAAIAAQVTEAVRVLVERGALQPGRTRAASPLPPTGGPGPLVAVLAEPGRDSLAFELCGQAARLAAELKGAVAVLAPQELTAAEAGSWGADRLVRIVGAEAEEDVALAVSRWTAANRPWALLTGSTAYGREIASRVAAAVGAGLTGDAIDLEVVDNRLVAWKPAFGGQLVAAIRATTPIQMATVRAGVLPRPLPRVHDAEVSTVAVEPRRRMTIRHRRQDDTLEGLQEAEAVIGIGRGVAPTDLDQLQELRRLLGAEIGCTRKVTDDGWMPHARQIGITGRSLSPRLYVAIGTSGKFNHMAGVQAAGTVLTVNPDPDAPVWQHTDVGVVATWQEALPLLVEELEQALATT